LPRHNHRFLGGGQVVVDGQNFGPLLHKTHHGGATIAHAFTRRLAGAHHDGDLVPETHVNLGSDDTVASLIEMMQSGRASWAPLIAKGQAG
jgi:hypothetical protein